VALETSILEGRQKKLWNQTSAGTRQQNSTSIFFVAKFERVLYDCSWSICPSRV